MKRILIITSIFLLITFLAQAANPEPTITGPAEFCEGTEVTLDAGAGYVTYTWSNLAAGQAITVSTGGTYSVTVTDATGCSGTDAFILQSTDSEPPVFVDAPADVTLCENPNNLTPYLAWTDNCDGSGTVEAEQVQVDNIVTFSWAYTDANGNLATHNQLITLPENPIPFLTYHLCEGDTICLVTDPFEWTTEVTPEGNCFTSDTMFTAVLTDAGGCTSEQTLRVTLDVKPPEFINTPEPVALECGEPLPPLLPLAYTNNRTGDCESTGTIEGVQSGIIDPCSFSTITYTWNGEDAFGNPLSNVQYITILPAAPAVLMNTPADITINCGDALPSLDNIMYDNSLTGLCQNTGTILGTMQDNFDPCTGGTIIYTWSGVDNCGNVLEHTQTVTVNLPLVPEFINAPVDITVECTGIPPAIPLSYDNEVAGNCSISGIAIAFEIEDFGICPRILQRIWEIPNTCGDIVNTHTQIVTIIDETPPLMDPPPSDITICEGELPQLLPLFWTDNCNGFGQTEGDTMMVDGNIISTWTTTDACGNSTVSTQLITVATAPEIMIDGPDVICAGNAFGLPICAIGDYISYNWNTGETGDCIVPTVGGTYAVYAMDINGCEAYREFEVVVNPSPEAIISGDTTICSGDTTVLTGAGSINYFWNGPEEDIQGSDVITVSTPGTYCLIVVDGIGCSGETCVEVIENPSPEPQILGSTTFCTGTSTTLDAGAGYESYIWSTGNTTQTLEVTVAGSYTVIVSDASGCTGEASIDVIESSSLQPVIGGSTSFCFGTSTTLDAGAGFTSYQWSTTSTAQTIIATQSGTYCVTVSDASGCTGTSCVEVTGSENPIIDIENPFYICQGETICLTNFPYEWTSDQSQSSLCFTESTTYALTVTDLNGCTAVELLEIIENTEAAPQPDIGGDLSICEGDSTLISVTNEYSTYLWNTGDTTQAIYASISGIFSVTVTDANGCNGSTDVAVTENVSPVVNATGIDLCFGESTTLQLNSNYTNCIWSTGDVGDSPMITESGEYSVTCTNLNGCEEVLGFVVNVIAPDVQISGSSTTCNGGDILLDAGSGFGSYEWSTGNIGQILTGQFGADTYCVTVSDFSGCTGQACIEVTDSDQFTPTPIISPSACNEAQEIGVSTAFGAFAWDNGSTTPFITVTESGTYTVTVTDASGCTGSVSIPVTISDLEVVDAMVMNTSCEGEADGSISLIVSSSNGVNINWNNGETNANIGNLSTGIYQVTISDNTGCSIVEAITVNESAVLSLELPETLTLCGGDCFEFPNTTFSYEWSSNTGNSGTTTTLCETGIYTITITDDNNCSVVKEMDITATEDELAVNLTSDAQSYCGCKELYLDISSNDPALTYAWTTNLIFADTKILACANGTYGLTITNQSGCTGASERTITLDDDSEDEGCVWPGDTDINGIVNNYDCLNIGLAFGSQGSNRPGGAVTWHAQYPLPWMQATPNTQVDFMQVDCDGLGSIGDEDFDVVKDNWLLTHNFTDNDDPHLHDLPIDQRSGGEVPFYVATPDSLQEDAPVSLSIILGESDAQLVGAYGVAFSVLYDPAVIVPNTATVSVDNSWLGTLGDDLYILYKDFHAEGRIDIGITRLDGQEMDGFGEIAKLNITIEDVILFREEEDDVSRSENIVTYFDISDYQIITFQEEEIVAETIETEVIVTDSMTSISTVELEQFIDVFPNPSQGQVTVLSPNYQIKSIDIYTIAGRQIRFVENDNWDSTIEINNIPRGLVLLKIHTNEGICYKKISVLQP